MPSTAKHIIGKQILEVNFEHTRDGYALQNEVSAVFYEKLLPAVEKIFDEVGGDRYSVSLESLSIDCGLLPAGNWEQAWVEQAVKLMREKLIASRTLVATDAGELPKLQADFLFFIEHGHLPWNGGGSNRKSFETISLDDTFLDQVKARVRQSSVVAERVVMILSEQKVAEIIKRLATDNAIPVADVLEQIVKVSTLKEKRRLQAEAIKNFSTSQSVKTPLSKNTAPNETLQEGIYISNAGLILLHPFLPQLFETCGLMASAQWRDEDAPHEAVSLLDYLVFGDNDSDLSQNLAQLLCGLEVDEPGHHEALTPAMKQECDMLLTEVIAHWSALKNTSPEALRNTFLKRQGKLTPSTHGWLLQVEQNAVDVLLGRLPWGYGTVKLQWMKTMIHTEWT